MLLSPIWCVRRGPSPVNPKNEQCKVPYIEIIGCVLRVCVCGSVQWALHREWHSLNAMHNNQSRTMAITLHARKFIGNLSNLRDPRCVHFVNAYYYPTPFFFICSASFLSNLHILIWFLSAATEKKSVCEIQFQLIVYAHCPCAVA